MSAITYYDLGGEKRLRDIVFAGSHDAGITSGGGNVQTQDRGIYRQAHSGIRIFDLRIFAQGGRAGKTAHLKAYHGDTGAVTVKDTERRMRFTGDKETVDVSLLPMGDYGQSLGRMLKQARKFVREFRTEFLILKFDKCTNWSLIAQYCVDVLGDCLYTGGGDLNRKSLRQLRGRVIPVFSSSGIAALNGAYGPADGILGFKNLYSKDGNDGSYNARFDGLQYYGKGGTPIGMKRKNTYRGKMKHNLKIQTEIMGQMNKVATNSSNVLGMIYWTSTGIAENIKDRNNYMWKHFQKFESLWKDVLDESIQERLIANRVNTVDYSSGARLRTFMPNIVMMDFATHERGQKVKNLNRVAATKLVQVVKDYLGDDSDDSSLAI